MREPLNPNERMKKDDDALHVQRRILDIYSKAGFDSIDGSDLRGRMRWMGLYTRVSAAARRACSSRRSSTTATS
jgi:sulfite reductase (ferredoxin)